MVAQLVRAPWLGISEVAGSSPALATKYKGVSMLHEALEAKGLSSREAEVAVLVSKGLSNKVVSEHLFVTEKTVKFHLTNIYKKLSVKSRAQLIVWCLPHMAFIESEPPLKKEVVKPQPPAQCDSEESLPRGH